jgi:hypothetical protein
MARISITFNARPWRNGKTRSTRRWAIGEAEDADLAAIVQRTPDGWRWSVYSPGAEGAYRHGAVDSQSPTSVGYEVARTEAKRRADEALRDLASP